jgi:hypothetical protein
MSAPPPELQAFHLGIVVRDMEAVMERYRVLLGVDNWHVREIESPALPWNPDTKDARVKAAYGRGSGQTFELLQVLEGRTVHSKFLEEHGEGVQHIGYWTPDIRASLEDAVAKGAVITSARIDPLQRGVVQLSPGSGAADIISAMDANRPAFVNDGFTMIQIEFIGPGTNLRDWLKEDFDNIVQAPEWLKNP